VIRDDKIGIEYQGGSAMVEAGDTDLIEQVLAARHRHPNMQATVVRVANTASSSNIKPATAGDALPVWEWIQGEINPNFSHYRGSF